MLKFSVLNNQRHLEATAEMYTKQQVPASAGTATREILHPENIPVHQKARQDEGC